MPASPGRLFEAPGEWWLVGWLDHSRRKNGVCWEDMEEALIAFRFVYLFPFFCLLEKDGMRFCTSLSA